MASAAKPIPGTHIFDGNAAQKGHARGAMGASVSEVSRSCHNPISITAAAVMVCATAEAIASGAASTEKTPALA